MSDLFGSEELFSVFEATSVPKPKRKQKRSPKPESLSPTKKKPKTVTEDVSEDEDNGEGEESKTDRSKSRAGTVDDPIEIDLDDKCESIPAGQDFGSLPVIKVEEEASVAIKETVAKSEPESGPSTIKTEEEEKEEEKDGNEEDEFDEYNDGNILLGKRSKLKSDLEALQKFLPQIEVKTLETPEGSGCTHVVATPNKAFYIPLHPIDKPVKTYPFKLDLFQERAVQCVDNYQSVLVSAHTSAGKTVVAEYAIAKGLKDNQRVIYTTPIKALSNQKYREFYEEFKDVGLITGDVTINPSASCLIMTTEILRNMLYRGSEIMREVGWVVFDEIHYMRDKERGVVWEETIILLPQKTHYVFLSATIPNAVQFAQWITHLHNQPCNVIHTEYRPVPLHHYLYPVGADGIHLIVDENGTFREDSFNTAMAMLQNTEGPSAKRGGRGSKFTAKGEDSPCHKVIKMAMDHDLAPVIVFSFSKKDCELYALQLSKLDFNSSEDKQLVEEVFHNAIDVLSKDDQKLPQVENLLPLLKRGIGIHHGGLLPLLKETIEILFGEGLIKVLFATETFAMGLNMPARTVLFTNVRKFDGRDYRWITSGEYIQMSGRAGRRGIDDKGITIVMMDEKISSNVGRGLLKGAADPINSAFHLTYNMVLNLMRVEEINPEFMMERSFYQFQNYFSIPAVCEKLLNAEEEYRKVEIPREEEVASYYRIRSQLTTLAKEFKIFVTKPKYIIPFLQPGRLVHVKTSDQMDFGWGAVVNFRKMENPKENPLTAEPTYVAEVLLKVDNEGAGSKSTNDVRPPKDNTAFEMRVVPVHLPALERVSQVRLYLSKDLRPTQNRLQVLKAIEEVEKRFGTGVPILDPVNDLKVKDEEFLDIIEKIKHYEAALEAHILHKDPGTPALYDLYVTKMRYYDKVQEAKTELRKAKSLLQMDELKCRKRVLRRLGYSSGDDVIEIKGRVACELTSADELLLTEMIFNGVFIDIDVPQTVALLSCLVCDERSNEVPKLSEELSGALKMMQDMARQISKVSKECKMEIDEDMYVDQFKPFLMDVVYEWCKGASFSKLCDMTDIFEGGIIRCMRRLEELLRQMSLAAKVIGNKELEEKFNQGVKLIKRDIVFAASLYL